MYPSGLSFFTLPSNYSKQLHTQIWELLTYGNGFTWYDVYNTLPIHWRRFYYEKLVNQKKKESEEMEKAKGGGNPKPPMTNIKR